ncbi:MAG: RimK/LysX family protein [Pseudomonadota bacterium]
MGKQTQRMIGWREWLALPDLGIERIKAKIDTGARTSSLHAFDIDTETVDGVDYATFSVEPEQGENSSVIRCCAPIVDQRAVTNSGGQASDRLVIQTTMALGPKTIPIELTLASRHDMRFRMLLGRHAIRRRFLVDPGRSYLMSRRDLKT